MSGDEGDYMTPISLAEWARGFYKEACSTPGFLECETKAGDVMYVPRGWWHMVLNVEPITIAVSHHFLSPTGLYNTLRLLRESPHQVSGIDRGLAPRDGTGAAPPDAAAEDHKRRTAAGKAMHNRLVAALHENRPEALACAEEELRREREKIEKKRERLEAQEELFGSRKKAFVAPGAMGAAPAPFAFNFA
jgi:ribosomal protein L16 Arg81 hydroxylase